MLEPFYKNTEKPSTKTVKPRNKDFILFNLNPDQYSCAGLRYLLFLYLGSLLVAAILSGPIFLIFLKGDSDVCRYIVTKGIDKTFDRIRLIFIILALPVFFKKCGIKSLKTLGYNWKNFSGIFTWTLIGGSLMSVIMGAEIFLQNGTLSIASENWTILWHKIPKFLTSALVVGVLEEIIFRGVVLRVFYTACLPNFAIILSSIFFAYLHIKIPHVAQIPNNAIGPLSGFVCIIPMIFGFLYKFKFYEFLKITILGIILSKLTIRHFSLNPAIGFHIGVVVAMFVLNVLY